MARKIRVLVIDDSAYNRRALAAMLQSADDVQVVARCSDGEDGIRQVIALKPDVITLDLEMPRMDGFTFLRLLTARAPTPVIVISSYARRQDVFKALELGAFDFIAKPTRHVSPALDEIKDELLDKVRQVRLLRKDSAPRAGGEGAPPTIVVVGASTGGPPAVSRLLSALPGDLPAGVAVAQHMPERFTRTFAERLDRMVALEVLEAEDGMEVPAGRVVIAPGGRNLVLERRDDRLVARVLEKVPADKYLPSIDRLFASAAQAYGKHAIGVVLTGMGNDGRDGALELVRAGGETIAESEESAVIFGMPKEVVESGAARRVLPLSEMAAAILGFTRRER